MGDGVLVYFGYPQAHEHDAERAVQAGLALVEAAPKLKTAARRSLAGARRHRHRARRGRRPDRIGRCAGAGVVGETPNLAARLQALAEPNMVVIAEGTRRLLGNLFELRGPRSKGPQGHRRAGAGLGGAAGEFRGKPLRGAAHDAA